MSSKARAVASAPVSEDAEIVEGHSRLGEIIAGNPIHIGYLIAYMANHYLGPVYKTVEAEHGLTSPEALCLLCSSRVPGINAIDIARSTGRPRNSVSRAISTLLRKHLMTVEPDLADRRRKRLVPSAAGAALARRIENMFATRHAEMLSVLAEDERDTLDMLLRRLAFRDDGWASPY
jgi:MarR family transcriptional regulator, temperature-dependent positive regulator of motility